jgi:hypothetical protein
VKLTDLNWWRLAAVAIFCSILAVWLALFGASGAGIQFPNMPPAGHLIEKRAADLFRENIAQDKASAELAKSISQYARNAFASAPLSPSALTILGRENQDEIRRKELFGYIFNINRRDKMLLTSALEVSARQGDIDGIITAIDRLIRVSPQSAETLFVALVPTLHDAQSLAVFEKFFAEPKNWSSTFLEMAAKDPEAVRNAALLRMKMDGSATDFNDADRAILRGLARTGDASSMMQFYNNIAEEYGGETTLNPGYGMIDWRAELPPIEWSIKEDQDVRASLPRADGGLEYYVRSGHGGLLASRTVSAPSEFRLRAVQSLPPNNKSPLRVTLKCAGGGGVGTTVALNEAVTVSAPISLGSSCNALTIEITARVRLREPTARGKLCQLGFVPIDQSTDQGGSVCRET